MALKQSKEKKKKKECELRRGTPRAKCSIGFLFLFRETPPTTSGGERRVVAHDANAQDLLGADQDQIFRLVRHVVQSQVVGLFEVQRGVRARDAPARVAHPSDHAVEIARNEDGHLRVRLVNLDTQHAVLVTTTLSKKKKSSQREAQRKG